MARQIGWRYIWRPPHINKKQLLLLLFYRDWREARLPLLVGRTCETNPSSTAPTKRGSPLNRKNKEFTHEHNREKTITAHQNTCSISFFLWNNTPKWKWNHVSKIRQVIFIKIFMFTVTVTTERKEVTHSTIDPNNNCQRRNSRSEEYIIGPALKKRRSGEMDRKRRQHRDTATTRLFQKCFLPIHSRPVRPFYY